MINIMTMGQFLDGLKDLRERLEDFDDLEEAIEYVDNIVNTWDTRMDEEKYEEPLAIIEIGSSQVHSIMYNEIDTIFKPKIIETIQYDISKASIELQSAIQQAWKRQDGKSQVYLYKGKKGEK